MTKKGKYSSRKMICDKDSPKKRSMYVIGMGAIIIFLLTFMVFTPVLKNDFVTWDDPPCIYKNIHIRSLDIKSLNWMLASFHVGNWHPLTWFSHALVYYFWGLNPSMHHLVNIILHAFNTLLVFFLVINILRKSQDTSFAYSARSSILPQVTIAGGIAALLFGLHPLSVEPVAWATERKGLLCTLFVLLTLLSYLTYTASTHKKRRITWLSISMLLFILALISKPMAVTLPLVLLLLDIYPLNRLTYPPMKNLPIIWEKIPFFILSIFSSVITIMAQHAGGAIGSLERYPLDVRLLNALRSLVFYLEKMIVPVKLVPFYPFPAHVHWLDIQYLISGILVLAITVGCLWMTMRKRHLFLIVWLYYVITLLPTLGIIQIGGHAAADRFTYLPRLSIFLFTGIIVSWLWGKAALSKFRKTIRGMLLSCVFVVILLLNYLTIQQIQVWKNSETLWNHVISAFPKGVSFAHNNLGNTYYEKGELDKAISEYNRALILKSNYADAHYNLGAAYADKGMLDEAISEYKKALAINPNHADAHYNLGLDYGNKGMLDEAISEYKKALAINPDYADAYYNLGVIYSSKRMCDKAISKYKKVLTINPDYVEAHYNLGLNYGNEGMLDEAIFEFKRALALKPNHAKAHNNLSIAFYKKGNYQSAIVHCDRAVELGFSVNPRLLKLLKPYR